MEQSSNIAEISAKIDLIKKGLPIDWLIRAEEVSTTDSIVYLNSIYENWCESDQKIIAEILQDHKESGGKILSEHNQKKLYNRKKSAMEKYDPPETSRFMKKLLKLVKDETVLWDKEGDPKHGLHRPMRQAWCNISLKMGGWGTINHIRLLKALYRRKRDQYNFFLREPSEFFEYATDLEFLKKIIERHTPSDSNVGEIEMEQYIRQTNANFDIEEEISGAPESSAAILKKVQLMFHSLRQELKPDDFSAYLTKCCAEIVAHREATAMRGLTDKEWKR